LKVSSLILTLQQSLLDLVRIEIKDVIEIIIEIQESLEVLVQTETKVEVVTEITIVDVK